MNKSLDCLNHLIAAPAQAGIHAAQAESNDGSHGCKAVPDRIFSNPVHMRHHLHERHPIVSRRSKVVRRKG